MSIRSQQKSIIKSLLETADMPVYQEYTTTPSRFPYCFITSGALTANRASGSAVTLNSTSDYIRQYQYFINFVTQGTQDISGINEIETQMDDYEGIIMAKLQSDLARDNVNWKDLFVTDVSSPINGAELNISETLVIKVFSVTVEYQFQRA